MWLYLSTLLCLVFFLYCIVFPLYCIVLSLYCIVLYHIIFYCFTLYSLCIVLYCIVLYSLCLPWNLYLETLMVPDEQRVWRKRKIYQFQNAQIFHFSHSLRFVLVFCNAISEAICKWIGWDGS